MHVYRVYVSINKCVRKWSTDCGDVFDVGPGPHKELRVTLRRPAGDHYIEFYFIFSCVATGPHMAWAGRTSGGSAVVLPLSAQG